MTVAPSATPLCPYGDGKYAPLAGEHAVLIDNDFFRVVLQCQIGIALLLFSFTIVQCTRAFWEPVSSK
jgi:hypothetical protein